MNENLSVRERVVGTIIGIGYNSRDWKQPKRVFVAALNKTGSAMALGFEWTVGDADARRPVTLPGKIMRRRLEAFVPIVLLAVLVQLMAPIAAFRVVAYATSDPLYMASLCADMTSASGIQTAPAGTQHAHGDCCAFCGAGHAGAVALDAPPLISETLQRQYQRISWLEDAGPMPAIRVGSNAQARAPPQLT